MLRKVLATGLLVVLVLAALLGPRLLDAPERVAVEADRARPSAVQDRDPQPTPSRASQPAPLEIASARDHSGERLAIAGDERERGPRRAIRVQVHWPAGTPADEQLDIWALRTPPFADLVTALDQLAEDDGEVAHLRVSGPPSEQPYELGVPADWPSAWVVARGRYLYMSASVAVAVPGEGGEPASASLSPRLGAWLHGELRPPTGSLLASDSETQVRLGFKLDTLQSPVQMPGTPPSSGLRRATAGPDGAFEFRGVDPDGKYRLECMPLAFAAWRGDEREFAAGRA